MICGADVNLDQKITTLIAVCWLETEERVVRVGFESARVESSGDASARLVADEQDADAEQKRVRDEVDEGF